MMISHWLCRCSKRSTIFLLLLAIATSTEATCNEEQIESCREAAMSGRLETLRSSGECLAKQYTEFSHLCSVTNYLPTVDFCCCRHRQDMLLCCRYHQDWNRFRCQEADDVIVTRGIGAKGALVDLPPLEILLPSTLVPLIVIIAGCLSCIVVCCCCRRQRRRRQKMNEASNIRCCCFNGFSQGSISCCCCYSDSRAAKRGSQRNDGPSEEERVEAFRATSPDEEAAAATTPLNRYPTTADDQFRPLSVSQLPFDSPPFVPCFGSVDRPCHCHHQHHHHLPLYSTSDPRGGRGTDAFLEPSAPPVSESIPFDASYSRTQCAFTSYPISDQCACVNHPYFESDDNVSMETAGRRGVGITAALCSHCVHLQPPPPYDESLTHRVV